MTDKSKIIKKVGLIKNTCCSELVLLLQVHKDEVKERIVRDKNARITTYHFVMSEEAVQ